MRIIEKIEIKSFRSFGNRKQNKTQITKIEDLNIFSGANDSGKSNILRALNLFFNKRTNLEDFLNFNNDFFTREKPDNDDVKEEQITIKITFWNEKNKGVNEKNKNYTRLPEKFWISRKWLKSSEFSAFKQGDGVETSFKTEKGTGWTDFYEKEDEKYKLKSNVRANLSKQLTDFLDSIQYHYVPAIKDNKYFSHLYGELQQTLLKEENSDVNKNKNTFQGAIQKSTEDLMKDFQDVVNNQKINISAVFELPDLIDLFKTLNVQTGKVNLKYRGDGIQAKLIPEILNFIAVKELQIKPSKIKKGEKPKKYFIWGFEEPENSYEYKNAQLLAMRFKEVFTNNAQIFLTTHSFNFLSIEGSNVSTYRVWKDENIESSRITKIKKQKNGQFKFEGNELNDDSYRLNEELGVFQLNQDLEELFLKTEKMKEEFLKKIKKIEKPIIYTEGNNVDYIKKAKELFLPDIDFDIKSLGGSGDMKTFFAKLQSINFIKNKAIFVFDCDARKQFNECEKIKTNNLIPYLFEKNTDNHVIKKGIENLFEESLFKDGSNKLLLRFFPIIRFDKGGEGRNFERQEKKLTDGENGSKKDFCNYICKEKNTSNTFKNFKPFFEKVKKTFQ